MTRTSQSGCGKTLSKDFAAPVGSERSKQFPLDEDSAIPIPLRKRKRSPASPPPKNDHIVSHHEYAEYETDEAFPWQLEDSIPKLRCYYQALIRPFRLS